MASAAVHDTQPDGNKFIGGVSMANAMISTGLLETSWKSLSNSLEGNTHDLYMEINLAKAKVIVLRCLDDIHVASGEITDLVKIKPEDPLGFLITRDNKSICINKPILEKFNQLLQTELKNKIKASIGKETPQLILVGQSFGGSLAALFALWAIKNRDGKCRPPFCVAFGAPFLGDKGLQRALTKVASWQPHFLNVVAYDDPMPRILINTEMKPHGTYCIVSEYGYTCLQEPESIIEILKNDLMHTDQLKDYTEVLDKLMKSYNYQNSFLPILHGNLGSSLKVDIEMQLAAAGMNQVSESAVIAVEDNEKELESQTKWNADAGKRLNEVKKQMAQLEWYKKTCEEGYHINMYDSYKLQKDKHDFDTRTMRKPPLIKYWTAFVAETENKPQTPDVPVRTRWLFGGTNYRRMVEPLEIADYYRKKNQQHSYFDNAKDGRKHQFAMLEEWERKDREKKNDKVTKKTKAPSLTEDSTFWAHVEEAILDLDALNGGKTNRGEAQVLMGNLMMFEAYVMNLIINFEVATTVFLENSTFMVWWNGYQKILKGSYNTTFTKYMSENQYTNYK